MGVDLGGELANDPGQLGVGVQLQFAGGEVVVGFGLWEGSLPILPDHDRGRQEDRLERDDKGQGRLGAFRTRVTPRCRPRHGKETNLLEPVIASAGSQLNLCRDLRSVSPERWGAALVSKVLLRDARWHGRLHVMACVSPPPGWTALVLAGDVVLDWATMTNEVRSLWW
jgi:hypothetical protein